MIFDRSFLAFSEKIRLKLILYLESSSLYMGKVPCIKSAGNTYTSPVLGSTVIADLPNPSF